jgi:hypothetical protein
VHGICRVEVRTVDYVHHHCASVPRRLKCTPNESYLVVTDTSGCICIFDVRERSGLQRADASLDEVLSESSATSYLTSELTVL